MTVAVFVGVEEAVGVAVELGVPVAEEEAVGVEVEVGVPVAVEVAVELGVAVVVPVAVAVGVPVGGFGAVGLFLEGQPERAKAINNKAAPDRLDEKTISTGRSLAIGKSSPGIGPHFKRRTYF